VTCPDGVAFEEQTTPLGSRSNLVVTRQQTGDA